VSEKSQADGPTCRLTLFRRRTPSCLIQRWGLECRIAVANELAAGVASVPRMPKRKSWFKELISQLVSTMHPTRRRVFMLILRGSILLFEIMAMLALPAATEAKPKSRIFDASPQAVFEAAYKVAREHHTVSYVDEKNWLITFHTGTSFSSWGFNCNASVEPVEEGKARLTINVQKTEKQLFAWGAGDRLADDFFNWVRQELEKENSSHSEENSAKGKSQVSSAPVPRPEEQTNSQSKMQGLQAAREVLKVGQKLDSAFSLAVEKGELQQRLVDFSAEVDDFSLSSNGRGLPNFVAIMRDALQSYKRAVLADHDRDGYLIEARNALSDARKDLENYEATGNELPLKKWGFAPGQ
jgi:hypothetical protein